jgi:hypothetical protein
MVEWKPDATAHMSSREKFDGADGASDIFLWVIPARVAQPDAVTVGMIEAPCV